MRTIFTLLFLMVFTLGVSAQLATVVEFEEDTDDDIWTLFANGTDSPDDITIVANPSPNEVNESSKVLEFVVHDNASTWVGMWSDTYGPLEFTEDAHILTMMVLKTIVSPSALKVEGSTNSGANQEVKVSNTLTDEWELLTFDLLAAVGFTYNRLVVFPDFPDARSAGTTVYIDNIATAGSTGVAELPNSAIKIYPNPVIDQLFVQHPGMKMITISDALGKTMKSYNLANVGSKSIDMSNFRSGIYFITVETAKGSYSGKFLKK